MEEDETSTSDDGEGSDRQTLRLALGTMSSEQLRALRSAIIRLKHLPFTKLTEVLFTEAQEIGEQPGASGRIQEDAPKFAYNAQGHFESGATRGLLEDVERLLRARENGGQNG